MIRFCDKEICCVSEDEMDWQQLVDYFLDWHMDEKVYVLDKQGRFVGSIIYNSLFGISPETAIEKDRMILKGDKRIWIVRDYTVLDENIWENGRKYFSTFPCGLLPVLNEKRELICFAWNDSEANREIRMLDELAECDGALDFKDIYPDADCVTVNGCNELAYYFVQYLKKIDISVNVTGGGGWDVFGTWEKIEVPDYRNFIVDAEGSAGIQKGLPEQRESVSAEFECIDRIYEENVINGMIKDADGNFQGLLERIKEKQIIIIGTGENSLNAYDLLLENGMDIDCFVTEDVNCDGKTLFGKAVKKRTEMMENLESKVFLAASGKHSAGGFGGTDFYHYCGCKRNKNYFMVQDYAEICENGYLNILNNIIEKSKHKIVLVGDYLLCSKLNIILEMKNRNSNGRIFYYNIFEANVEKLQELKSIKADEVCSDDIFLLLIPAYYGCYDLSDGKWHDYRDTVKKQYLEKAEAFQIIDYPFENVIFMQEFKQSKNIDNSHLVIKEIVLGSIADHSGNIFFRGILDNHPEIMMMGYSYLNDNLFYLCLRLSMVERSDIISSLWEFYYTEGLYYDNVLDKDRWDKDKINKFNENMEKMLSVKERFTSQELFIIIHIAYAQTWLKITKCVSDMVIYWEPHHHPRKSFENYTMWLEGVSDLNCVIEVVRHPCSRRGSQIKGLYSEGNWQNINKSIFGFTLAYMESEKLDYNEWKRIVLKFEDLKCKPHKELSDMCDKLHIEWSDSLLETTLRGQQDFYGKITGFDLKPVYHLYEEYYSSFDRFRIELLTGLWQKKHGYSYVSSLDFSRKELREMFAKEFRFEEDIVYQDESEKMEIRQWLKRHITHCLWKIQYQELIHTLLD